MTILNDYHGMLGGLVARMYGLNAVPVNKVILDAKPVELRLM